MDDPRSRPDPKLSRLLRAIRRERGVTQVQLAERVGLPQSIISRYENGERLVFFQEVVSVCQALGVSMRTFVRRLDSMPDDFEDE